MNCHQYIHEEHLQPGGGVIKIMKTAANVIAREQYYDSNNHLIETKDYDEKDGHLIGRSVREYDTGGKLLKMTVYDSDNEVIYYRNHDGPPVISPAYQGGGNFTISSKKTKK